MPRFSPRLMISLAFVHGAMLMTSILFAMESLEGLDDQGWTPSLLSQVGDVTSGILIQPVMSLWLLFPTKFHDLDQLEWGLFALNSLLWGAVLAYARVLWQRRKLT